MLCPNLMVHTSGGEVGKGASEGNLSANGHPCCNPIMFASAIPIENDWERHLGKHSSSGSLSNLHRVQLRARWIALPQAILDQNLNACLCSPMVQYLRIESQPLILMFVLVPEVMENCFLIV